jgi:hypothetical protein
MTIAVPEFSEIVKEDKLTEAGQQLIEALIENANSTANADAITALTERVAELEETAQAVIDDDYPIGCVATFIIWDSEIVPATGGIYEGSRLQDPVLTFATATSTVAVRGAFSPPGTWKLVGPPGVDVDLTSSTLLGSFNFKRIS